MLCQWIHPTISYLIVYRLTSGSSLTLKRLGGGKIAPPTVFRLFKPYSVIRNWPVNISKFKYVHPGHFATILRSPGWQGKYWAPGEVNGPTNLCDILTHFGIFDPLRVKISTLPTLCFMFYYHIRFICNKEIIKIQQKNCIPPLGVAPGDLRVWPLEALVRCKKAHRHP